jgi:hypothetical protein
MSRFELVREIPWEDLVERVKNVPLKKPAQDGTPIRVYQNADIQLREFSPNEVSPTTFYLLEKQLKLQEELHEEMLSRYNINTLKLNGAIEIKNEKDELWTVTPPVIELAFRHVRFVDPEGSGQIPYEHVQEVPITIINDGAHRVMLARNLGQKFNGIYIHGTPKEHPFYAHPNSWDKIKVYEKTPERKSEKKMYMYDDCYALYRDFETLGCGAPRKLGGENERKS